MAGCRRIGCALSFAALYTCEYTVGDRRLKSEATMSVVWRQSRMGVGIVPPGRPAPLSQARLAEFLQDPRRAITELGVVCLVCGHSFRHLTNTHLRAHELTSGEYKQRFGYNTSRALMIAPLRRTHSDNASQSGLAHRIRRRPIVEDVELRRLGGRHPHTLEETLTRRERPPRRVLFPLVRDSRGRFSAEPDPGPRSDVQL